MRLIFLYFKLHLKVFIVTTFISFNEQKNSYVLSIAQVSSELLNIIKKRNIPETHICMYNNEHIICGYSNSIFTRILVIGFISSVNNYP